MKNAFPHAFMTARQTEGLPGNSRGQPLYVLSFFEKCVDFLFQIQAKKVFFV